MSIVNGNGVTITDKKLHGHLCVDNAKCWCGETLMVAPKMLMADHKAGDPILVCYAMSHTAYRFTNLTKGVQVKMIPRKINYGNIGRIILVVAVAVFFLDLIG